jgi:hypothetical protein
MKTQTHISPLDALLVHHPDNSFVRMVRWFFFYPAVSGRAKRRPSRRAPARKALAH